MSVITMRALFVVTLFPEHETINVYIRHVSSSDNSPFHQYADLRNRIDLGRIMKIPFLTLNLSVEFLEPSELEPTGSLYIPSFRKIYRQINGLFYNSEMRRGFMEKANEIGQIIISELTQDFNDFINPDSWRVETCRYYDSGKMVKNSAVKT